MWGDAPYVITGKKDSKICKFAAQPLKMYYVHQKVNFSITCSRWFTYLNLLEATRIWCIQRPEGLTSAVSSQKLTIWITSQMCMNGYPHSALCHPLRQAQMVYRKAYGSGCALCNGGGCAFAKRSTYGAVTHE